MEDRPVWRGWRKNDLMLGETIVASITVLWCGCIFVNERGWGRGRLKPTYKTIPEAKKAAEVWALRRAVRKGVRDDARASAGSY